MVATSERFGDLLETNFTKIFADRYKEIADYISQIYGVRTSSKSYEKTSSVGALTTFDAFDGGIDYDDMFQGYDKTISFEEYAKGLKVERKLFDDDQQNIMNKRPMALGRAAAYTRQLHGVSVLNEAFTTEPTDGDGAELCASDHGSTADSSYSVSNEGTTALSQTAVEATRLLMKKYTDDRGNKIIVNPDMLIVPLDLELTSKEIVGTDKQLNSDNNNKNMSYGSYKVLTIPLLSDTNNWFMVDSMMMKEAMEFYDRIPVEFFQDKDSDTLLAKFAAYMRYGYGWNDFRFIYGHKVS